MNQKKELSPRKKREEAAANRILLTFLFSLVLLVGLMLANRGYRFVDTMFATRWILYGVAALGLIGLAYGAFRTSKELKQSVDYSMKALGGPGITLFSLVLGIYGFVGGRFYLSGIGWLYVFVPSVAVLTLIFLMYPRSFFYIAGICACGGYLMWFLSGTIGKSGLLRFNGFEWVTRRGIYASILAILALIAAAILFARVKKSGGILKLAGRNLQIMDGRANYRLIFTTIALVAVLIAVALLVGGSAAYYLTFAVFGYLFIIAVYYTVKMM